MKEDLDKKYENIKHKSVKDHNLYASRETMERFIKLEEKVLVVETKLSDISITNTQEHKEIKEILVPISETYKAVNLLGKWIMALLVFVSILGGIIFSWYEFFKRK